jgi:hypothetical protein
MEAGLLTFSVDIRKGYPFSSAHVNM